MRNNLPHNNVYVRLQRSSISGIGVFAIIDIPKDTYVFEGDKSEMCWYSEEELKLSSLPQSIQDLYNDFCVIKTEENQKLYGCPDSFNNMPISWYLNNSDNPNMVCNKDYDFYTIRDVKAGEELTSKYDTYSE
jgi:SET domain-containing protein